MDLQIRTVGAERIVDFVTPVVTAFGNAVQAEYAEALATMPEFDVRLGGFDGDALVGAAGSFSFAMTTPGGTVPTAGLTMVGVLPSHRRRGVLSQLMRQYLDGVHERGQPVSALWASEGSIYGRFGYGMASLAAEIEIDRDRSGFVGEPADGWRGRLLAEDEALEPMASVWEEARGTTPGMPSRSAEWWRVRRLSDEEFMRRGRSPLQRLVLERDGRPEAYALYRIAGKWEHWLPAGSVDVLEALAVSPGATRALWRYLFDIDAVARINAHLLPADHPLLLLVQEPARLRMRLKDGLWVRLVDVGAALAARSFGNHGPLVLEIEDGFCAWNAGRWRLAGGTAKRTGDEPELRLGVDGLASVYLGGFTFAALARAGRLEELTVGAVERADGIFRSDRAPWCPEIF